MSGETIVRHIQPALSVEADTCVRELREQGYTVTMEVRHAVAEIRGVQLLGPRDVLVVTAVKS